MCLATRIVAAGLARVSGTHHHDFVRIVCSGGVVALYSMEKAGGCQRKHQQQNKPTPCRGSVATLGNAALRYPDGLHFCL